MWWFQGLQQKPGTNWLKRGQELVEQHKCLPGAEGGTLAHVTASVEDWLVQGLTVSAKTRLSLFPSSVLYSVRLASWYRTQLSVVSRTRFFLRTKRKNLSCCDCPYKQKETASAHCLKLGQEPFLEPIPMPQECHVLNTKFWGRASDQNGIIMTDLDKSTPILEN